MKTVLVVGSGGREHALAWKLSRSPRVDRLILAPGNDGMPAEWERWSFSFSGGQLEDRQNEFQKLAVRARANRVDLVVVGPDNPLADGLVDILEAAGILTVGPKARAAQIESSKAFAKEVMQTAGVPTPRYWVAHSEEEARKILKSVPWPILDRLDLSDSSEGWVIKADGLALGKGVRVCGRLEEALEAVPRLIAVSGKVLIEERVAGEELSWMAFCDGTRCALLQPARDYKRLLDHQQGPNTGGMGAMSPVPGVTEELHTTLRSSVFLPVLKEMKLRGAEFRGILYAGLMWDRASGKFWVLEFNARLGDPETQVLLPRVKGDLFPWLQSVARGDLGELPEDVPFIEDCATLVVAASRGYPERPEVGKVIRFSSQFSSEGRIFFAGVRREDGDLLTSGGRVLGTLGVGATAAESAQSAYDQLTQVKFEGMQFRTDIGRDDSGRDAS